MHKREHKCLKSRDNCTITKLTLRTVDNLSVLESISLERLHAHSTRLGSVGEVPLRPAMASCRLARVDVAWQPPPTTSCQLYPRPKNLMIRT